MNFWIGIGRIAKEPDFRISNNEKQTPMVRYSIAAQRFGAPEGQPNADFIDVVAFGKNAEFVRDYFHKGMRVAVRGQIRVGSYTNKDGQKVKTWEIFADSQEFADGKWQNQNQQTAEQPQNQGYQYQPPTPGAQMPQTGYYGQTAPTPPPTAQPAQPQYQAPPQYGYQAPPQAPPQMTNEQFMQIPDSVEGSLPFN